jgi:hypothetical protein
MNVTPEEICPTCHARFSWTGRAWIIVDKEGRMTTLGKPLSDEERPRPDIRRCVACHSLIDRQAKVRVEEVKE